MQVTLPIQPATVASVCRPGGLLVRTGLRGGACVEVNDQVKAALKTVSDALSGTSVTAAPPATTASTPTAS